MKTASITAILALLTPAALAQDYVNIGEYQGGVVETPAPSTYEIIALPAAVGAGSAEIGSVGIGPVQTAIEFYSAPPVYTDVQSTPMPVETVVYQAAPGIMGSVEMGITDQEYEAARLAAYDTNRDGTITTAEAISTLKSLTVQ